MALRQRQLDRIAAERNAAWSVFGVVRSVSPEAETHIFGSHVTRLNTPASDVDLVLQLQRRRHFSLIASSLRQKRWVSGLKEIASA